MVLDDYATKVLSNVIIVDYKVEKSHRVIYIDCLVV